MNGIFKNLIQVCSEIWKNIGIAQRTSIVMVAFIGVVAISSVIYMGTRPNWQVLYKNIDTETASKVYQMVKDEGIPVQLKDSGRTILVPYKNLNDLRLKIAEADIEVDQKGVGMELFDEVKLGLTEMQQRVGYQRALQGELQRMIREVPGVEDAKVMLVVPSRHVFKRKENDKAKASVLVIMKRGHMLSEDQVSSISHMVAGSIDSIEPMDVTISDNRGRLLAKGRNGVGGSDETSRQMDLKAQIESELRQKAEAILRPVVGMDAVVAMVTGEFDFNNIERVEESYNSLNSVVVSEKIVTDENTKADGGAGGTTGMAGNTVSVRNPGGSGGSSGSQQSRKTVENQYVVPKITSKTVFSGPRIKNLHVAVTIALKPDKTARTKEELDQLRDLVKSAVGAINNPDAGRVDTVTVVESDFMNTFNSVDAANITGELPDKMLNVVERYMESKAVRPLMGLFLLIFLYHIFGSAFKREHIESVEITGGALDGNEQYAGALPGMADAGATAGGMGSRTAGSSAPGRSPANIDNSHALPSGSVNQTVNGDMNASAAPGQAGEGASENGEASEFQGNRSNVSNSELAAQLLKDSLVEDQAADPEFYSDDPYEMVQVLAARDPQKVANIMESWLMSEISKKK